MRLGLGPSIFKTHEAQQRWEIGLRASALHEAYVNAGQLRSCAQRNAYTYTTSLSGTQLNVRVLATRGETRHRNASCPAKLDTIPANMPTCKEACAKPMPRKQHPQKPDAARRIGVTKTSCAEDLDHPAGRLKNGAHGVGSDPPSKRSALCGAGRSRHQNPEERDKNPGHDRNPPPPSRLFRERNSRMHVIHIYVYIYIERERENTQKSTVR